MIERKRKDIKNSKMYCNFANIDSVFMFEVFIGIIKPNRPVVLFTVIKSNNRKEEKLYEFMNFRQVSSPQRLKTNFSCNCISRGMTIDI